MEELLRRIETLQQSTVSRQVKKRIQEFHAIDKESPTDLFKELCFCILTANFSAERSIHIHSKLLNDFCTISQPMLTKKFRQYGYRFPTTRAYYIVDNQKYITILPSMLHVHTDERLREWLVQNVKGLGYKEASHFLRNIGFDDYAIIDSHILELLEHYSIITQPKTLTKKTYLSIEKILYTLAQRTHLTLH